MLNNTQQIMALSLFSGCGGMDLGLEGGFTAFKKQVNETLHKDWISKHLSDNKVMLSETGIQTIYANDIDKNCKKAWECFFGAKINDVDKIPEYSTQSIVTLVKQAQKEEIQLPKAELITGGFPCQPFSVAGKRQGFQDLKNDTNTSISKPSVESRGMLYYWMRELINLVQPKMFIAENVHGLTTMDGVQQTIEHDFSTSGKDGYLVVPAQVLHAADYGVSQSRKRVIFFGFNKTFLTEQAKRALLLDDIPTDFNPYPTTTHSKTGNDSKNKWITCQDILQDLPEPEQSQDISQQRYSKAKFLGLDKQGNREINYNSIGPTIRANHHGNIEYRRLSEQHGGQLEEELKSGLLERRLTVRECARIQSFPDEYDFSANNTISMSAAYKMIGNAVPPLLAYAIGCNIQQKWNNWFV